MGLVYINKEESRLYEAYGLTVYGVRNRYEWTIYNDRPDEVVYTALRIEQNGNEIINLYVGNRCIFEKTFNDTIDDFLWWIAKDKPDAYELEKTVFKCLCETNSLFLHQVRNRKAKERDEAEMNKKIADRKAEEEKQIAVIKEFCARKGYVFKQNYKGIYLFSVDEKYKGMIENADVGRLDDIIQFIQKHPTIEDAKLIMFGTLEEIYGKVK